MNKNTIIETLKGLEIIQMWLAGYDARITNINLEEYTVTIYDEYEDEKLQTKDISEVAKHFARIIEDNIISKVHDDKISQITLNSLMSNFRDELKTLTKLIKK